MAKKTMSRRDLIKLAGTVSAFGAVLGFSPRKGHAGGRSTIDFAKVEVKFYKEQSLFYDLSFPEEDWSFFGKGGSRINAKIYRGTKQIGATWSWTPER
jgi:hypothetical protein